MCEEDLTPARAYVVCLRTSWAREHTSDIGGDRKLSHGGDLPRATAIMAGVTHNNADVIAPRNRFHWTLHISRHRPALDSFIRVRKQIFADTATCEIMNAIFLLRKIVWYFIRKNKFWNKIRICRWKVWKDYYCVICSKMFILYWLKYTICIPVLWIHIKLSLYILHRFIHKFYILLTNQRLIYCKLLMWNKNSDHGKIHILLTLLRDEDCTIKTDSFVVAITLL
jgi:hypothetical protein